MPTKKREKTESHNANYTKPGSGWTSLLVLVFITLLTCLAAGYSGLASASPLHTTTQAASPTPGGANPTAGNLGSSGSVTGTNSAPQGAPPANPTVGAGLTATIQAGAPGGPASVATGGPSPVPTSGIATGGATTGSASGGDFPWLIVTLVALLVIGGLVFAAMRQRRPVEVGPAASQPQIRRRADIQNLSGKSAAPRAGQPDSATVAARQSGAAAPLATTSSAVAASSAAPVTVACPNCGTSNATTEKYCHNCGEDLRPALAELAATVAPGAGALALAVDVVAEDTPYLETLDRVDEQLEFVLSRPRIAIGSAPGNDIVVDAAFKGWRTVSPQHAELRREQDGFVVVDRESEHGTFVNEMRTGENILSDGDLLRLGDVRFTFRVPESSG